MKISFIGDVMCKREMIKQCAKNDGYDFDNCFKMTKSLFEKSDLVIANLETPISFKNSDLVSEKYRFNAPYEFAEAMFNNGIQVVSTANNHCLDRGIPGIQSTVKSLDQVGMKHTGVFVDRERKPLVIDIEGVKLGILSYTYGTNADSNNQYLQRDEEWMVNLFQNQENPNLLVRYCANHNNIFAEIFNKLRRLYHSDKPNRSWCEIPHRSEKKLNAMINELQQLRDCDLRIMCLHIGGQYNSLPTHYTKEVVNVVKNAGCDIVICNHEHTVQGINLQNIINNQFVAYALGNFLGVAGVIAEPYDKYSNYSIACHLYVQDKTIIKVSYTILKTVLKDDCLMTYPIDVLANEYEDEYNKTKLWEDSRLIACRVTGIEPYDFRFQSEYTVYERK